MYTIGQLAKKIGLSRSTLLHYDSIGLFSPSGRSNSNYRTYTEEDRDRLEQLCTYRRAGLSLNEIGRIMKTRSKRSVVPLLEKRLDALNREIRALRNQQHFIVRHGEVTWAYPVTVDKTPHHLTFSSGQQVHAA